MLFTGRRVYRRTGPMPVWRSGPARVRWGMMAPCRPGSRTAWPGPRPNQLDLKIGDKVTAKVDLPGVPEGTPGKVILANGFNWLRAACASRAASSCPILTSAT